MLQTAAPETVYSLSLSLRWILSTGMNAFNLRAATSVHLSLAPDLVGTFSAVFE